MQDKEDTVPQARPVMPKAASQAATGRDPCLVKGSGWEVTERAIARSAQAYLFLEASLAMIPVTERGVLAIERKLEAAIERSLGRLDQVFLFQEESPATSPAKTSETCGEAIMQENGDGKILPQQLKSAAWKPTRIPISMLP